MPGLPNNYVVSWWYTPTTKLGLYFNDFAVEANQPTTLQPTNYNSITADNGMAASLREEYKYTNLITSHPVENSTNISDHIINLPREITIYGAVTSLSAFVYVSTSLDFSQLGNCVKLLEALGECRTGISVTTGLLYGDSYFRANNLACESMTIFRDEQVGKTSTKFSVVFKQLNIVSSSGGTTLGKTAPASTVSDRAPG